MVMRLGIWTPLPHVIQAEPAMTLAVEQGSSPGADGPDGALAFASRAVTYAEQNGFEVTLVAERWLGPDHSAWLLATALACVTSRIELMVAVHPGLVTPQAVAKMGATLDRISGGRFSINVVNGWWPEEMNVFGNGAWLTEPTSRYGRMDEFIRAVRRLWTEDEPRMDGAFFKLDGTRLPLRPVQLPCPPIYAASRSEPGKETIARYCDCWFVEYDPDFRQCEANMAKVAADIGDMRARAARHGRGMRFGLSAHVICADDHASAVAEAEALEAYGARDRVALTAAKALGAGLLGSPATIARRIGDYADMGVDTLMLRFHPMLGGLETFVRRVKPLLTCLG